jgi:hypothetical protein
MRMRRRAIEAAGVRRNWRRPVVAASLVLIVALGLLAAACGGGSTSSDQASADQPGAEPAQTTGGSGQTTEGGDEAPLPGVKEFGLTEEEYAAHIEETQALIATCMAEAGFEYVPADVEAVANAQAAVRVEPGFTEEEYKQKFGFGVTTRFDNVVKEIELGPQNLRIIEDLSEADRAAYERTLYGDDPNSTFAFTFDEEDFSSTGGCTRQAVEQVFTPEQLKGTYINPKDTLIENDPRVVEANANWVACMQDAGYDGYVEQDEIIEDFEERLEELIAGEAPATLTGARAEELKQLQEEEIAVALADHECQLAHLRPVIEAVEVEVYGKELD